MAGGLAILSGGNILEVDTVPTTCSLEGALVSIIGWCLKWPRAGYLENRELPVVRPRIHDLSGCWTPLRQ